MRFGLVAVAGLMVAAVGQAQTRGANAIPASQYAVVTVGCPGQLTAQQQAKGAGMTVWTMAQGDPNGLNDLNKPGLGVRVGFQGGKAPIRSLELQVSYLPPGLRYIPTDQRQAVKDMRESDKTFVLQEKDVTQVAGDLLVGPAATITRVHLMSVTYADGSVWHPSSADACSVVPNRVMEVATK